jgi:alpha-glucosidase
MNFFDSVHYVGLGELKRVVTSERGILVEAAEGQLRIDVIRVDLIRLKVSVTGSFDEAPTFASVFEMPEPVRFEIREDAKSLTLVTAGLYVVIRKRDLHLNAYRADGTTLFEGARSDSGTSESFLFLNDEFVVSRRRSKEDAIFGLGQKTGPLDRSGQRYLLWNLDILSPNALELSRLRPADPSLEPESPSFDPYYSSTPFYYHAEPEDDALSMAGFFVDNGYLGAFDLSHDEVFRYRFSGGQYTEYVFAGPTLREILEAYTFVTGRMPAPPLYALGQHQSRWHDYTETTLLALAHEYRSRDIPCDVLWLDIGHMDGFRVFTFDPERFPDVPRLVEKLEARALRAITIIDPGIKYEPGYAVFDAAVAGNHLCKTDGGAIYTGEVWPGRSAFPDFVKPEARKFWGELNARHVATGIAGIWNDMNEPATGPVSPFAMRFDRDGANHPHERYHNQYALLMAEATREGLVQARPNERPFILSRAGFAGIQRYAAQWLGDNQTTWEHLALSVRMALGMGVSGQPFVGSDIPGFVGEAERDLFARWVQYGALTPFCRFHKQAKDPDHYPWSFGPEVEAIAQKALKLRYRLLPYLYSAFMRATETGEPVQRPLHFDFQEDPASLRIDDQYLLGDALLVAPVLEPAVTHRDVYLPPGSWTDFHTGTQYGGKSRHSVETALDHVPLFARGGKVIPMYAAAPRSTMDPAPDVLELHAFAPSSDSLTTSLLHEDDGTTFAFRDGAFLRTALEVELHAGELRLRSRTQGDGFPGARREKLAVVLHDFDAKSARLDGRDVAIERGRLLFPNRGENFELLFRR